MLNTFPVPFDIFISIFLYLPFRILEYILFDFVG